MTISSMYFIVLLLFACSQIQTASVSLGILLHFNNSSSIERLVAYVDRFSSSKCEAVSEVNIIWKANQEEDYKRFQTMKEEHQQNLAINSILLGENQTNLRFVLPINSKAEYFYVSFFDFDDNCDSLEAIAAKINIENIDGLIPIIGEEGRTSVVKVDLTKKFDSFLYQTGANNKHFTFVENIRLISRHFIELSQSGLHQVVEMTTKMDPICEQLLLNVVAAHFYPELKPKHMKFGNTLKIYKQQSRKKTVCVQRFITALGYLPTFYQRKGFNKTVWTNPNTKMVISLKKGQLNAKALNKVRQLQQLSDTKVTLSIQPSNQSPSNPFLNQKTILLTLSLIVVVLFTLIFTVFLMIRQISASLSNKDMN